MMQSMMLFALVCSAPLVKAGALSAQAQANPIEKVIEMMSELQQKIIKEGEAAQKIYDEFAEWCEEESKNLQFEIKTGKAQAEELTATIDQAVSDIKAGEEKIEELAAKISQAEADLKAATEIRDKEHSDFLAEEADLVDTVDALERAIGILEREMAKTGGAAFLQLKNADSVVAALKVLVESASISTSDASRLTAFLQNQQESGDNEYAAELGAPDPAAYKSKSGGIVDVLNDLLADAEGQLADARKKESNLQNNYEMLKMELEDAMKFGGQEMDKTKKANAASEETKAEAEGDLEVTNKALAEDIKQLADTHQECMTKATDFEAETASRAEELKVIAQAKKIIIEATGGATAQTYSFLQVGKATVTGTSRLRSRADLTNFEAVKYVTKLSESLHSAALAQLANRMSAAARMGAAAGEDPFAKVKGLIADMIEQLLKEAAEDAAHKAYCDKEMSETKAKKEELTGEIEALSTKIDKMSADSAKLKEEVAILSKELADLAKSQAEMDKLREEENTAYKKNKAEMEEGLEGIKLALKVLRDYYAKGDKAHASADGAASGIIGMLEVVESDFSKGLAEMISIEESAAAEYEKVTKENEIAKTTKEQDVKYKTKEAKSLDKAVAEHTSDREGLQTELDAVLDYWTKIQEQCVAKAEPYEERKKRREAEIAGLKEALAILEGEAALLQKGAFHRHLRRHQ
jgi:hypothetical protein